MTAKTAESNYYGMCYVWQTNATSKKGYAAVHYVYVVELELGSCISAYSACKLQN